MQLASTVQFNLRYCATCEWKQVDLRVKRHPSDLNISTRYIQWHTYVAEVFKA